MKSVREEMRANIERRGLKFSFVPLAFALALAPILAWTGCQSSSPQYVAPRFTGRVVDETTQRPIKGVEVRRVTNASKQMETMKGGEKMNSATLSVATSADGAFALPSERVFALFQNFGWYSVTFVFKHPDYELLTKTYTLRDSTNTPAGESLVQAGDVPLKPLTK